MKNSKLFLALLGLLSGCSREKPAPKVETNVQNAFTDYVDRGKTTMDNAQTAADTVNANTHRLEQQAQSVAE